MQCLRAPGGACNYRGLQAGKDFFDAKALSSVRKHCKDHSTAVGGPVICRQLSYYLLY